MGQAKRRGTYDERKAAAIHDTELARQILIAHAAEFRANSRAEEKPQPKD